MLKTGKIFSLARGEHKEMKLERPGVCVWGWGWGGRKSLNALGVL